MTVERATRLLLAALVLCLLAGDAESQRRRRGGGGASGGRYGSSSASRGSGWQPLPEGKTSTQPLPIFLPGFDAAGKGAKKGGKKRGGPAAARARASESEAPTRPIDPSTEADLVTAGAEHVAQMEEAQQRLLLEHFGVCDLDGNGWLSLRESEITLSFDRDEYRRADANADGRLAPEEFARQHSIVLARMGVVPELEPAEDDLLDESPIDLAADGASDASASGPEVVARKERARRRRPSSELASMPVKPADIVQRYDEDESKGIDAAEIEVLFVEAELTLSPDLVVAQLDADDSGQLEPDELVAIAWMASEHLPPDVARQDATEEAPEGAADPDAPLSGDRGTHFGRLDADRDGFIGEADLRAIQSPVHLEVRLKALLSGLDADADGRISETEFRASMTVGPR